MRKRLRRAGRRLMTVGTNDGYEAFKLVRELCTKGSDR
jgi:hypothetical protein